MILATRIPVHNRNEVVLFNSYYIFEDGSVYLQIVGIQSQDFTVPQFSRPEFEYLSNESLKQFFSCVVATSTGEKYNLLAVYELLLVLATFLV
jgi:hypothetical protein